MRALTCIFLVFLNINAGLFSQCKIPQSITIPDENTIAANILISGTVNNNLSSPNQGICAVKIKFNHSVLGDLDMFLISPAGQQIQLVGASGNNALTNGTTWDVTFSPCGSPVSPDLGISPVWDNNESWGNFQQYDGSYYPYSGCLEDFNIGTVNGTWTLLVEDVAQLDEGLISSFELVFCDDNGIVCGECKPPLASPNSTSVSLCQGSNFFGNELDFKYLSPNPDTNKYTSGYIIFGKGKNFGLLKKNGLSKLDSGQYKMCLLTYTKLDSTSLPQSISLGTIAKYEEAIITAGVCADFGTCLDLNVVHVSDTIRKKFEICPGESVTENGIKFTQEGKFQVTNASGLCDTIIELDIDVINLKPTFIKSKPIITCVDQVIDIEAKFTEAKPLTINWFTNSGVINSATNLPIIKVSGKGTYYLNIEYGGCSHLDSIFINADISLPVITLNTDTLTCDRTSVNVNYSTSSTIVTTTWKSASSFPFMTVGNGIKVSNPDTYIVTLKDNKNCEASNSIKVEQNLSKPQIEFEIDSISCAQDSVQIDIIDSDNLKTGQWKLGNTLLSNNLNYFVKDPLTYRLVMVGFNGCKDSINIKVEDSRYTFNVSIPDDTITCTERSIVLKPISDSIGVAYVWRYNSQTISLLANPSVSNPGVYSVLVVDKNFCTGSASVTIKIDTLVPNVTVSNRLIDCVTDSVIVSIDDPRPGYGYHWFNNTFSSTLPNPVIKATGLYNVIVTDENLCTSISSFSVFEGPGLPNLIFTADTLKCDAITANITPNDTLGLDFLWLNPNILSSTTSSTATVDLAGIYNCKVTKRSDGCTRTFNMYVPDIRQRPIIDIVADTIGCLSDSAKIQLSIDIDYNTILWESTQFTSSVEDPVVTKEGFYKATIVDNFGCVSVDSVVVIKQRTLPVFQLVTDLLKCDTLGVDIEILTSEKNLIYEWSKSNTKISTDSIVNVKVGGIYNALVTNKLGCKETKMITVGYDTIAATISFQPLQLLNCINKEIPIIATTSELVDSTKWTGPGIVSQTKLTAVVDEPGIYILEVKDRQGCISKRAIEVKDSSKFIIVNANTHNVQCDSLGFIELSFDQQPVKVKWTSSPIPISDDIKKIEISKPGNFVYNVLSDQGCETIDTIIIVADTLKPKITKLLIDTLNCVKNMVTIGVESDVSLENTKWQGLSNTTPKIQVSSPGKFVGETFGKNGCSSKFEINVILDNSVPSFTLMGDTIDCNHSKIDLQLVSNDFIKSVQWLTPDAKTLNGKKVKINMPGKYVATVTGRSGCIKKDSIDIFNNLTVPTLDLQDTFYLPCNFSPIRLFVNSPDSLKSFRWIADNSTFSSTDKNPQINELVKVRLFAASTNGCNAIDSTLIVLDKNIPKFKTTYSDTLIKCKPGFVDLTVSETEDDSGFIWIDANNVVLNKDSIRVADPGIYKVIVTGNNFCKDSVIFNIASDSVAAVVDINLDRPFECSFKQVSLLADVDLQNINFKWTKLFGNFLKDTNTLKPIIDESGIYILTVEHRTNGCVTSDTIKAEYKSDNIKEVSLTSIDPICFGAKTGSIDLISVDGLRPPHKLIVDFKEYDGIAEGLGAGNKKVLITDSLGCEFDTTITIADGVLFRIDLPNDTTIILGKFVDVDYRLVTPSSVITSLNWNADGITICENCDKVLIEGIKSTMVKLIAKDTFGCTSEDQMFINVIGKPRLDLTNVISVSGSEVNRRYFIPATSFIEKVIFLRVYDNWGNLIFNSENAEPGDPIQGWDATFNGSPVNPGVFVSSISILLKDGKTVNYTRDITVVR